MAEQTGSIQVLHVDDDPDFADLAGTFLEREDDRIETQIAHSPEQGSDILSRTRVDCIVSDYDMPRTNGIEFLEIVREDHPDLPFILFTGKGSEEVAADAISEGVTDYLQKESGTDQYAVLANRIANVVDHYRSQQEVEQSEQRLREVIDTLPHLLYVVDNSGTYVLANQALADFHNSEVNDIEGANVADVLADHVAEEFRDNVAQVRETGSPQRFEPVEITDPDGSVHIFEPRVRPFDFAEHGSRSILGIAVDITERIEQERELHQKERRYQAVFNDPNILVGLIDTDGTVLDINDTAMEYIDRSLEEIVGRPFWEAPWFTHSTDLQQKVREWIDHASTGEYVEFEANLERPTGEPYWIEGVFRPVTDDDGEVVSLLISDRDITERKERERELNKTTQQFQAVLDTVEAAIFIKDTKGRYQLMNQECRRLLGVDPGEEIIGRTDDEFLPEDDAERYQADDQRVIEGEETIEIIEEVPTPEGTQINLTLKTPFYDDNGEMRGVCAVSTDITERKKKEKEIKRQNQRFDELASTVSHDLQTPIETARGRAELAIETGEIEHMELALEAIQRTDQLRRDLVEVLRTKEVVSETDATNLVRLGREVWEMVATEEASIEFSSVPPVVCDSDAVRRMFENLFSNAIEHGGNDVTVRVGRTDDGFYIDDDGSGIPEDQRMNVFMSGFSTKANGSGVGLASVREIVNAHGWEIYVTEGVEGGARFEINGVEFTDG